MSEEILKAIKNKKTAFYNWKTNGRIKDIHDPFLLEKKITTYELRKNCRKEMAQKRIQEKQTITEARTSDKTLFYRIIRHQRGKLTRFIDELYVGSQTHNTEDQILEGWKSHFEQLAERSISENYDKDYLHLAEAEYQTIIQLCKERVVHVPVTKQEVKKAINSLNRNKATDFYGMTAENIVYGGDNLVILIDNIFVSFGGILFQQVVGIPMGTNCAPLLAELFLYSYESEFLQKLVKDKKIHEARAFNFTYRYIDDVLSTNNSRFAEFLPLIYPPELEVKETTDTASSASFLDLYLEFDDSGQISTKIYDKRDDFNFMIIIFPNMCSNIPASPAYGVYISQLIRYARARSNYSDFLKRHLHLRNRLLDQGYKKIRLIRSLKKFIFRYQDLVEIYSVSAEKIINDGFSYSENV